VETHTVRDPTEITSLLAGVDRALIVDAVLDPEQAGAVKLLEGSELAGPERRPVSSHGIGVITAVELGRVLAGKDPYAAVSFLTIGIGRSTALGRTLSPGAAAAVEDAARLALSWALGAARA
jgi:hydrogenase maturation protease